MTAKLLGKEAALFAPSGTMGNLICVLNHCLEFGSKMILGDECHIYIAEQGGSATLGRIYPRTVPTQPDGTLLLKDINNEFEQQRMMFIFLKQNFYTQSNGRKSIDC